MRSGGREEEGCGELVSLLPGANTPCPLVLVQHIPRSSHASVRNAPSMPTFFLFRYTWDVLDVLIKPAMNKLFLNLGYCPKCCNFNMLLNLAMLLISPCWLVSELSQADRRCGQLSQCASWQRYTALHYGSSPVLRDEFSPLDGITF